MAMTWEQMSDDMKQQLIEQMTQQITQLTARANAADEEHRRVHTELERTQAQLTQGNATGGSG